MSRTLTVLALGAGAVALWLIAGLGYWMMASEPSMFTIKARVGAALLAVGGYFGSFVGFAFWFLVYYIMREAADKNKILGREMKPRQSLWGQLFIWVNRVWKL